MKALQKALYLFFLLVIPNLLTACDNPEYTNCIERYENRYLAEQYSLMHAKSRAKKSCKNFK